MLYTTDKCICKSLGTFKMVNFLLCNPVLFTAILMEKLNNCLKWYYDQVNHCKKLTFFKNTIEMKEILCFCYRDNIYVESLVN